MHADELKNRNFESELIFSASRSQGPGGQNVNKVNTKMELRFRLENTTLFTQSEKEIIFKKLKNKINKENELVLVSQEGRTQMQNKLIVTEKFYELIARALTLPEIRRATQPTLTSKIKRLDTKKFRGKVKKLRNTGYQSEDT